MKMLCSSNLTDSNSTRHAYVIVIYVQRLNLHLTTCNTIFEYIFCRRCFANKINFDKMVPKAVKGSPPPAKESMWSSSSLSSSGGGSGGESTQTLAISALSSTPCFLPMLLAWFLVSSVFSSVFSPLISSSLIV